MASDIGRTEEITGLLKRLSAGDTSAEEPLANAVHAEIRQIAKRTLNRQTAELSVQPTALANEVLMEAVRLRSIDWRDRQHFFRTVARMMRRRIVDAIRRQKAAKRPPSSLRIEIDDIYLPQPERFDEILFVHEGLKKLEAADPDAAELVEMIYFGGVTIADAAKARGVSEKTIDRHLEYARRWLRLNMSGKCPPGARRPANSDAP